MKRDQLIAELGRIKDAERPQVDALAKQLSDDARQSARAAVEIWTGSDPVLRKRAARLLAALDDLAIVPLLDAKAAVSRPEQVWRLRQIVRTHLELRGEIASLLDRMMDDKNVVPPQQAEGPVEEEPPAQRLCDVAYVQMRRLLNPAETRDEHFGNVDAFLQMEFEARDREIARARKSRTWTDWTGRTESDESEREEREN
jgi:hypothetical protein